MPATVAGWVLAALIVGPAVAEAQNATGKPTISGHKVEGERLILGLGGISDPDGDPFTNIHRAWYRVNASNVETRIRGAIGNWYEPVQADVGKRIKVEVSFRDAGGNRESVTSDLTTPIVARPRLTIHDLTVNEPSNGTRNADVRVSLDRASPAGRTIQLNFRYRSGTAIAKQIHEPSAIDPDYLDVAPLFSRGTNVVAFAPGETEATIPIGVYGGNADGTPDAASEEFYIELFNHQWRWVELATTEATITIVGDASIAPAAASVLSNGASLFVRFTAALRGSGAVSTAVQNAFTVTVDGSEQALGSVRHSTTNDHALVVNLGAGVTITQGQTVTISYVRRGSDPLESMEGDKVHSFSHFAVTNDSTQTRGIDVSISPKPDKQRSSEDPNSGVVTEGSPAEFTLTRSGDAESALMVDVSVTESGSMLSGTPPATVTFDAGSSTAELSVPTEDDKVEEPASVVTATVSSGTGYTVDGSGSATVTVEDNDAGLDPLTAQFTGVPAQHDGSNAFTFRLAFSEDIRNSYKRLRDDLLSATAGTVTRARRVDGRRDLWEIQVDPAGNGSVTVTLSAGEGCRTAPCTTDGRTLSQPLQATIGGPPGLSVADAEVEEAPGARLQFAITLARAAAGTVTVQAATSDGTALAGQDYRAKSAVTKTFAPGETTKIVVVRVLDDSHDEGAETLTLTLSNPSGAYLADGEATGTITNQDPLPRALLARFGRTAAVHVVEQVEERVNAPRAPGFDGRVAGRAVNRDMGQDFARDFVQQLGGGYQAQPAGMPSANGGMTSSLGPQGPLGRQGPMRQGPGMHGPGLGHDAGYGLGAGGRDQLLVGSGFALNRATSTGGVLSFWSRSASSSFHGQDGALALNGDVRSTMFGADYSKGRMVTGVSLSHTRGLGGYAGAADTGRMTSAVTGLYPWIGFKPSERVTVWTVAGYGAGGLLLNPGNGAQIETGLSMAMAAGGGRGRLMTSEAGFELAFKADALWVGTRTDAASGASGNLRATRAGVTRLRTALEGSKSTTIARRMAFTPSVEVGIRQDGGDAEVGRGLDVGIGLTVADGVTGLAADVRIRRLLVHQAAGFAQSGIAVSVSYDPTPKTPLGFTARVSPAWGGDAMSGADALWGRETVGGMGHNDLLGSGGNRLDTEVGYGLPLGSRFVGTPRVGIRTSEYGQDYRLGYGVGVLEQGRLSLQLGVDAERRQSPVFGMRDGAGTADQRVFGTASVQW